MTDFPTRKAGIWMMPILILLTLTACPSSEKTAEKTPEAKAPQTQKLEGVGKNAKFHFSITMAPEKPKLNEMFKTNVKVTDAKSGAPIDGAQVKADATMPEHRHGMMTKPIHKELGGGKYTTEGMKLHMHGAWRLHIEATQKDGATDFVEFDYTQQPVAKQ